MKKNEHARAEPRRNVEKNREARVANFSFRRLGRHVALCLLLLLPISTQQMLGVVVPGRAYDLSNPSGLKRGGWEEVQGLWFGKVSYITQNRGVRRPGSTVEALLVIGPNGKFLTVKGQSSRRFGTSTSEYYRIAPPHKVLNNIREYCRLEKVDNDGNPLPDSETGMVIGLTRPQQNQWKEFARIDFNSQGGEGLQMDSGIFIRPMERPFRQKDFGANQLFSVIYGNDWPGTSPETRAEGIAELKKLFQTFKKQGFHFVHSENAVVSGNDFEFLSIQSGPVERSIFVIYCRGDAKNLYVEATQGPGAKFLEVKGQFPKFIVIPHKWTSMNLTEEFQICNSTSNVDLTRPAKFGGGSTVEVTIIQFSNSLFRGHREFDFNKLR